MKLDKKANYSSKRIIWTIIPFPHISYYHTHPLHPTIANVYTKYWQPPGEGRATVVISFNPPSFASSSSNLHWCKKVLITTKSKIPHPLPVHSCPLIPTSLTAKWILHFNKSIHVARLIKSGFDCIEDIVSSRQEQLRKWPKLTLVSRVIVWINRGWW